LYPTPFFPFPIGREVSGVLLELPTDEAILNSPEFKKRGFKKGGTVVLVRRFGLLAIPSDRLIRQDAIGALKEYVSVPWDAMIYPVPDNVPPAVAAASLGTMLTTLTQITEAYNVKEGDTVFVHTVAGGTGLIHAQLAKMRGAIVIGTTSTAEKAELAKANGADHVILYKEENTVDRVSQLTNGKGVDVIFDGVGRST
jgi:NADPH:quinone reductase